MAGDPYEGDEQDQAEVFDETNITRDGEDIADPDMARDVYDVTSAQGDEGEDGEDDTEDFDPDKADEAELEFMLESDDGVDEPRAPVWDNAEVVSDEDQTTAEFEAEDLTDAQVKDLGYEVAHKPSAAVRAREERLDEGLEETFPASDPVSISPGAD